MNIVKYPFERYLTYLILKKTSLERINRKLKSFFFPPLTSEQLLNKKKELANEYEDIAIYLGFKSDKKKTYPRKHRSKKQSNESKKKSNSAKSTIKTGHLKDFGILSIWNYGKGTNRVYTDKGFEDMYEILTDPKMSLVVRLLSLQRIPPKELKCYLNFRHKKISVIAIRLYCQLFWNIECFQNKKWKQNYLDMIKDDPNIDLYKLALDRLNRAFIEHKLGYVPFLSRSLVYREIFATAYYEFEEYAALPKGSKDRIKNMERMARIIFQAGDRIESKPLGGFQRFAALPGQTEEVEQPAYLMEDVKVEPMPYEKSGIKTIEDLRKEGADI